MYNNDKVISYYFQLRSQYYNTLFTFRQPEILFLIKNLFFRFFVKN